MINQDIEAKLIMFFLLLKEQKNKKYSGEKCDRNVVYLFQNEDDFVSYFTLNGIKTIDKKILRLCKMKETKKGTIIALKSLCDYTIKAYYEAYDMNKELTQFSTDGIKSAETPLQKRVRSRKV